MACYFATTKLTVIIRNQNIIVPNNKKVKNTQNCFLSTKTKISLESNINGPAVVFSLFNILLGVLFQLSIICVNYVTIF